MAGSLNRSAVKVKKTKARLLPKSRNIQRSAVLRVDNAGLFASMSFKTKEVFLIIWRLLEFVAIIAALVALGLTIVGNIIAQDSLMQSKIVRAWTLLGNKAPGNSGKKSALETLVGQGEILNGLDLSCKTMGGVVDGKCENRVYLVGVNAQFAQLVRAKLEGADLRRANLEGADLEMANLEGSLLMLANLAGADLRVARLEGAWLQGAHFEGANLQEAHLEGAYLRGAHLEGANLRETNLEGAKLWRAHLAGADLWQANLEGADLVWANLEGASLLEANLQGAKGVTIEQLKTAINVDPKWFEYFLKAPSER